MSKEAFDSSAIATRLPVWRIFADLFLDTWFDPDWYDRAAAELSKSGFTPGELRQILLTEVAPAFYFNLQAIAGEWAGWYDDTIVELIQSSADRTMSLPIRRVRAAPYARAEWKKLAARLV